MGAEQESEPGMGVEPAKVPALTGSTLWWALRWCVLQQKLQNSRRFDSEWES